MCANLQVKYAYRQYPFTLRQNSKLSDQQKISREKSAKQKPFTKKLTNSLLREGKKLKMMNQFNHWWIKNYRFKIRQRIIYFKNLTPEEIVKHHLTKLQFIEFLQKDCTAWDPNDVLEFRLNTMLSIFQLKQYYWNKSTHWSVNYIPANKRLPHVYSLFIMNLRATRLLNKKLDQAFELLLLSFIENNDLDQELYDFKYQAYRQFLF